MPTALGLGSANGVTYVILAEVGKHIKPHRLTRTLAAQVSGAINILAGGR